MMYLFLLFAFSLPCLLAVVIIEAGNADTATTAATTTATTTAKARQRQRRDRSSSSTSNIDYSRESIIFDFNWKHRLGLHDWPNDPYEPPINTTALPGSPTYIDPGENPKEAQPIYDDSNWITIQTPHDAIISNPYGNQPDSSSKKGAACPDGCSGHSYIPRHVIWYRKQFKLPSNWYNLPTAINNDNMTNQQTSVFLQFEGSFRNTTIYLNGKRIYNHECGYTPFNIELFPTTTTTNYNNINNNTNNTARPITDEIYTVAVFVDPNNGDGRGSGPSRGSGWWYEGGGLYRHVKLTKLNKNAHLKLNTNEAVFVTSRPIIVDVENDNEKDEMDEKNSLFSSSSSINLRPQRRNKDTAAVTAIGTAAIIDIQATFEVEKVYNDDDDDDEDTDYCYSFEIIDDLTDKKPTTAATPLRKLLLSSSSKSSSNIITVTESLTIKDAILWTSSRPHLYEVTALLYTDCGSSSRRSVNPFLVDSVTVSFGIRSIKFDSDTGFELNNMAYKIRGFCDHDTFAVVGMAMPDRIHLFRAQASRSIGGNARRASHNPPDPVSLDIYDRLGMVVINENRLFANNTRYVQNMADLVLRDRNHPSVIIWSFCNEVGCEDFHEYGGPSFQNITKTLDPTRPTLANMFTYNDLLSNTIDIQGFSHQSRAKLDECHKELPNKPIVQSECCSCNTMRNEDEGCETYNDNPHTTCNQKSFNGRCLEKLVNASDGTEYASGTFVWTLFDYYGEPPSKGLTVSSTYGQYDLCGFPKSAAFWFRSQWLLQSPASPSYGIISISSSTSTSSINNGKPFSSNGIVEVHIVESWESPENWKETKGNTTRTIHAYSNAPVIELFVNAGGSSGSNESTKSRSRSQSQGKRYLATMKQGDQGTYGEWFDVRWEFGSITAIAQTIDGAELARTTKKTNVVSADVAVASIRSDNDGSNGVSLVLSLDCPSPNTGTGDALFLDGQDVALVRATIVDSTGTNTLYFAVHNITFRIISGPGYIQGTANGDPKSYQSHTSKSQTAYHGLVRAVVRVTSVVGLSSHEKDMIQQIETIAIVLDDEEADDDNDDIRRLSFKDDRDIVLEATSPGLAPTRLVIPTSTNQDMESVLAIASQGANRPVNFF